MLLHVLDRWIMQHIAAPTPPAPLLNALIIPLDPATLRPQPWMKNTTYFPVLSLQRGASDVHDRLSYSALA